MKIDFVKYQKIRAVILYSMTAIAFICCYFEVFLFDDPIGELLKWFGVKYTPMPIGSQVMFAIIFAVFIISLFGVTLTYRLESLEEHADDEEYYKVKRSFFTRLIEGRYVKPSNRERHPSALSQEKVIEMFNLEGKDDVYDENLQLRKPMTDFVKFCKKNELFKTYHIDDWRLIDMSFHDKKGGLISAQQLSQCYQDLQQRGQI